MGPRCGGGQVSINHQPTLPAQEIRFPKMVTSCCRFLCYFCRISRQNQRSMFDHLSYLLENSGIGLGENPGAQAGARSPTAHSWRSIHASVSADSLSHSADTHFQPIPRL